ncbi:hypothetical protein [Pseudorhodoferax sp. Leaf265]|uniref:hypothetical protein n=1 Tax=Pseudorhodoferax sp. Leaf265 TaxID=1736315 RepID=UPI0006F3E73A|nr:hypothetical protein [Pseudorhodoferax sp. Leaf265]KQP20719.1 hypothetical protein ASF45_00490 [Pseudorhodoferax sp. Leaf265]
MRDLPKAALERAIFVEFAQRWRADIDLASVASGNPNAREPDILAKSSESDQPLAIELVRLTEQDSQMLARQAPRLPPADAPPARLPPMASAVDAFSRKFKKAEAGLYDGVEASRLELLAWSDHLATPWPQVLVSAEVWLTHYASADHFAAIWLWRRPDFPGDPAQSAWVWSHAKGLQRFG